jgi:hypothetical protein
MRTNLSLRMFATVLILAAVAAAPVFAGGQHLAPRCIPSDRHVLGCKPIPGPFDKASNDDVVQFEAARARKQAEAANTPAPVQTPTARELTPQPKTPEPTAEPNAAVDEEMDTILEDADISSGEEEEESSDDSGAEDEQSSDEVADPELDGDVSDESFDDTATEENSEDTSEEEATDEEAENEGGDAPGECNSEDDDPDNDCE